MASLASFFGWRKASEKELQNSIVLSWENQTFDVTFRNPSLNVATLRDLKEKCKQLTGVPMATMRLVVSGAHLKDDTATLTSCGVRAGSTVVLTGEKVNREAIEQTASGNPEEYGLMVRIDKIMDPLRHGLVAEIETFQQNVMGQSSSSSNDIKVLQDKGVYLTEKIMQALISLDGVECPPEFQTARQRRREGVKFSQQLLERVDTIRAKIK